MDRIKNYRPALDRTQVETIAEGHFTRICGFDKKGDPQSPKLKGMLERSKTVGDRMRGIIVPQAIISEHGTDCLQDSCIRIEGRTFYSEKLKGIEGKTLRGVYSYLITVGEIPYDSGSIMDDFYADTWGTAFVDGVHDSLLQWAKEQCGGNSHYSFGPGIFGMDIGLLKELLQVMDGNAVGVTLTAGGMMKPVKSSGGFFLFLEDDGATDVVRCNECEANYKNCSFCKAGKPGCK